MKRGYIIFIIIILTTGIGGCSADADSSRPETPKTVQLAGLSAASEVNDVTVLLFDKTNTLTGVMYCSDKDILDGNRITLSDFCSACFVAVNT